MFREKTARRWKGFAIKGVLDMFMSTNEPENFNWHDAEIKSVDCENKKMTWKVDALNVLTSNSQNSEGIDLCASTATVVFENYFIENIKRYGFKKYQDNNLIEEQPDKMLSYQEVLVLLDEMIHDTDDRFIRYIHGIESSIDEKKLCISVDIELMADDDVVCMDIRCISLSKDFFDGEKIAVDAEIKVLYQEDEDNLKSV
nr:hypothetical protein [uncultured Acetatifactor sp.]